MMAIPDLFIVDGTYKVEEEKPVIYLFCRGEDGKSYLVEVHGFEPYFFVKKEENVPEDERIVRVEETDLKNIKGHPVKKIVTKTPGDVKKVRDLFSETYEADILFVKRFIYDKNIFCWIRVNSNKVYKGKFTDYRIVANVDEIEPLGPEEREKLPKTIRVAYIDIEVYFKREGRAISPKYHPIISISVVFRNEKNEIERHIFLWHEKASNYLEYKNNNNDNIEVHLFERENLMLIGFLKFLRQKDFDIIVGWNSIKFDYPFIVQRMKHLGISPYLGRMEEEPKFSENEFVAHGRLWIDGIDLLKSNFFAFDSWKLDFVAKEIVGEGKVEFEDYLELMECWENCEDKFIRYNVVDSELVLEIVERTGVLNSWIMQAIVAGVFIVDTKKKTAMFDSLVIRESRRRGMVLPTKKSSEKSVKYLGARVISPKKGVFKYVAYLDYTSLYPSIMITFNISFETIDPNGEIDVPNYDTRFRHPKHGLGVIPTLEKYLLDRRSEAKKLKKEYKKKYQQEQDPEKKEHYKELYEYYDILQLAFKIIANSFYGAMGYEKNRVFDVKVAESITVFARFWNEFTEKKAKEFGYDTIYGDTDSIFIETKAKDLKEAFDVALNTVDRLNQSYVDYIQKRWNIPPEMNRIDIKLEGIFEKILFTGVKKRYVGIFYESPDDQPSFKVKGFETRRTDWAPIAKELQKLTMKYALEENIEELKKVITKYIKEILEGKHKEKLIVYKQVTKDPREYKSIPPHVRAFLRARKLGKQVFVGDKVGIIKTTKDWVAIVDRDDLDKINNIDYQYYIEKQIKPAVERILAAFNLKFEDIYENKKQATIDDFF